MTHLLSDLRFALRTFRRNPGFTAIAVLSIALGIGANTAIFTLVDQVLLRLLPVKNPQQLVQVTQEGDLYGSNWGDGSELSYPTYTEIRDRNKVFSGVLAMALAIVGLYRRNGLHRRPSHPRDWHPDGARGSRRGRRVARDA